jgi:tRNA-specific 2-thiouridylase
MKVAVALSGGVDSAVTAILLKEAGYEVVGVMMRLWKKDGRFSGREACFSPDKEKDIASAAELAKKIDIPFEVIDCANEFEDFVLKYFRSELGLGRTPNPCVECNRLMKFGLLLDAVKKKFNFDKYATGHYASVTQADGRFILSRAADRKKDQSYFLWSLSQEQLSNVIFPLGGMQKDEVRSIARKYSLSAADKSDSQDFYSGDTNELLDFPVKKGKFISCDGKVLGEHNGFWNFTVGQRRGLGFAAGEPMYVYSTDACRNVVTVGPREGAVKKFFTVSDVNWVSYPMTDAPIECKVKVRSTGEPCGAVIFHDGKVTASNGIFGVCPGQSAVFYDVNSEKVICGGIIAGEESQ